MKRSPVTSPADLWTACRPPRWAWAALPYVLMLALLVASSAQASYTIRKVNAGEMTLGEINSAVPGAYTPIVHVRTASGSDTIPISGTVTSSGTATVAQGADGVADWGVVDATAGALLTTANTKLNGGLPAALAAGGGLKIEGVAGGVTVPVTPAATEAHLGAVGGNTTRIAVTPTVSTSPAYSNGDVVGGVQTLTSAMRVSGGTGILQSIFINDKGNQKAAFELLIFNQNPSNGTYTDNGAFSLNATDEGFLIRRVSVSAGDYLTLSSHASADLGSLGRVVQAVGSANLYVIAVLNVSTPTYATTTDLTFSYGFLQD